MHAIKHDKGDKQPALVTQQRYKLPGHTYDSTTDGMTTKRGARLISETFTRKSMTCQGFSQHSE